MPSRIRGLFRRRRRRVQLAHEKKPTSMRMKILVRSLLATLMLAAVITLFPFQVSYTPSPYLEGTVAAEDITAPFDFEVPKSAQDLETERARVAEAVLPVFTEKDRRPNYVRLLGRLEAVRGRPANLPLFLDSLQVDLGEATPVSYTHLRAHET